MICAKIWPFSAFFRWEIKGWIRGLTVARRHTKNWHARASNLPRKVLPSRGGFNVKLLTEKLTCFSQFSINKRFFFCKQKTFVQLWILDSIWRFWWQEITWNCLEIIGVKFGPLEKMLCHWKKPKKFVKSLLNENRKMVKRFDGKYYNAHQKRSQISSKIRGFGGGSHL